MAGYTRFAEMEEAEQSLFLCTRQPGRLRISPHACALRYLTAQRRNLKSASDEFEMALISGLKICQNCPDGRRFAEKFSERLSASPPARKRAFSVHGGRLTRPNGTPHARKKGGGN